MTSPLRHAPADATSSGGSGIEKRHMMHLRSLIDRLPEEYKPKAIQTARTLYAAGKAEELSQFILRLERAVQLAEARQTSDAPEDSVEASVAASQSAVSARDTVTPARPVPFETALVQPIAGLLVQTMPEIATEARVPRALVDQLVSWADQAATKTALSQARRRYDESERGDDAAEQARQITEARTILAAAIDDAVAAVRADPSAPAPFDGTDPETVARAERLAVWFANAEAIGTAADTVAAAADADRGSLSYKNLRPALEDRRAEMTRGARIWFYALVCERLSEPWMIPDASGTPDPEFIDSVAVGFLDAAAAIRRRIQAARDPAGRVTADVLTPTLFRAIDRAYGFIYVMLTRTRANQDDPMMQAVLGQQRLLATDMADLLPVTIEAILAIAPVQSDGQRIDPTPVPKDRLARAQVATLGLARFTFLTRNTESNAEVINTIQTFRNDLVARCKSMISATRTAVGDDRLRATMHRQLKAAFMILERLGYADELRDLRRALTSVTETGISRGGVRGQG